MTVELFKMVLQNLFDYIINKIRLDTNNYLKIIDSYQSDTIKIFIIINNFHKFGNFQES